MATPVVTLTPSEFLAATHVGVMRQHAAITRGAPIKNNLDPARTPNADWVGELEWNIRGAAGELACCKYLGIPWNHSAEYRPGAPDIGDRTEVRATHYTTGKLWLFDQDKPDRLFILVIAKPPRFRLAGWMLGADARRPEWWGALKEGAGPTYNVPQPELRPMPHRVPTTGFG